MSILSDLRRTKKNAAGGILSALNSGNPMQMLQSMISNNPQLKQQYDAFKASTQGMTPQQVATKYGVPWSAVQNFMRR